MDMLKSCYMEFKTIIIHSDSDQTIINNVGKLESSTLMLISNSSKNNIGVAQYLHMPLFIMTPKSRMAFHDILMSFKSSPLWNIMAPFLILDKSNRECMNARNILKTAWEMNVVKSFFLCVNSKNVSMIYTYNPYTNRAPQPWKNVKTTRKRTDGWTMYSKSNREVEEMEISAVPRYQKGLKLKSPSLIIPPIPTKRAICRSEEIFAMV
ncbi:hypothetical protein PV326_013422 [Microctonus aethiopoides]|nr:hypothetical protein PV326_013422 [Microctonus aethiopoides]